MPLLQIVSTLPRISTVAITLTFMLRVCDHFADHRLDHSHVAIESSTKCSANESHPKVGCKPNGEERYNSSQTAEENNRLSSYPVRERTPKASNLVSGALYDVRDREEEPMKSYTEEQASARAKAAMRIPA